MQLTLNPDIQRFIEDQVRSGRYSSPESLIEAAVADMRDADEALDDEAVSAINEAEAQGDRGEGVDLDTFRKQMQRRITGA